MIQAMIILNRKILRSVVLDKSILFFASLLANTLAFGCADIVSHDEVARSLSPDKKYECVVFERNGGATTSFGYWIYLCAARSEANQNSPEPEGNLQIANLYGASRNDNSYGVNIRWKDSQTIIIECLKTKESELHNPARLNGKEFKVILKEGVSDPSAPAGGMLYNIEKSKPENKASDMPAVAGTSKRTKSELPPKE